MGQPEDTVSRLEQPAVVDTLGMILLIGQFLAGQQAFLGKKIQIDKVGIACRRRRGLVGAVPVRGGIEGQNLPARLTCRVQKINEIMSGFTKASNAVWGGQTADRHNNARLVPESKIFHIVHKIFSFIIITTYL